MYAFAWECSQNNNNKVRYRSDLRIIEMRRLCGTREKAASRMAFVASPSTQAQMWKVPSAGRRVVFLDLPQRFLRYLLHFIDE